MRRRDELGVVYARIFAAANTCLQRGEVERAKGYFDTAATYYYLTGLSNGGELAEWACQNVAALGADVEAGTLYLPPSAS